MTYHDIEYVYSNVNEDGLVYNQTESLTEALQLLADFPNDMLCITVKGGWRIFQGHTTDGLN